MAQSIREVMTKNVVTLETDAPVLEAAQKMRDADIGDIIVLDGQEITGIITDRDIVVRVLADGRDPSSVKIGDIASKDVETVSPDDSVGEAVKLMSSRSIRRLPVVENGSPVGIVSIGDLAIERDPDSALADISAARPNE